MSAQSHIHLSNQDPYNIVPNGGKEKSDIANGCSQDQETDVEENGMHR
jgi:hypothetical protein